MKTQKTFKVIHNVFTSEKDKPLVLLDRQVNTFATYEDALKLANDLKAFWIAVYGEYGNAEIFRKISAADINIETYEGETMIQSEQVFCGDF